MYYQTSEQERISLGFGDLECNNGVHFCGFYETPSERDELIMGFIRQGFRDNAHILYAAAERDKYDFLKTYQSVNPDVPPFDPEYGSFTFTPARDLYFEEGIFSPDNMLARLEIFYRKTQESGKRHVRATAEMSWAADAQLERKQLMAYESRLNYFIPGKPWISICLYNLTRFNGQEVMQVLQTHPYSIVRGNAIMKNPYFMNPDDWLATYAPEYLLPNEL